MAGSPQQAADLCDSDADCAGFQYTGARPTSLCFMPLSLLSLPPRSLSAPAELLGALHIRYYLASTVTPAQLLAWLGLNGTLTTYSKVTTCRVRWSVVVCGVVSCACVAFMQRGELLFRSSARPERCCACFVPCQAVSFANPRLALPAVVPGADYAYWNSAVGLAGQALC
jgi:hypothetical protein